MNEEIKEIKTEPTIVQVKEEKQDLNPFDYVTIPLEKYIKLVKKVERLKAEVEREKSQKYHYYNDLCEARENVEKYKTDMQKLLGIQELKQVKEQEDK